MLKPFFRSVLAVLLAALLSACVSLPGGDPTAKSSESVAHGTMDPSDHPAEVTTGSGNTRAAAPPVPEVSDAVAEEFSEAVSALQEGRYADAEVLLLTLTSEHPELAGPWINLGQVYVALDQPEDARRAFEAAVAANPYNCTAHNELGLLARKNGDFEGAERQYLACLEHDPDNDAAYLNLGILYELYLGRLPEALASYRQYQALAPEPDRRVAGWVVDLERRVGS
jgi:tetratricopeptide (TPR) repeat protein